MNTPSAVEFISVSRRFGSLTAVDALTLSIRKGETLALLGTNGAGKTTAIRMLCGLLPANSGEIRILGHPAGAVPPGHVSAFHRRKLPSPLI